MKDININHLLEDYSKTHTPEQVKKLMELLSGEKYEFIQEREKIEKYKKLVNQLELNNFQDEIRFILYGDFVAYARFSIIGEVLKLEEFITSNAKNKSPSDLPLNLLKVIKEDLAYIQEKGLGVASLIKLAEFAKSNGCCFIELDSAKGADGFYEKAFQILEYLGLGELEFSGEYNVYRFMIYTD